MLLSHSLTATYVVHLNTKSIEVRTHKLCFQARRASPWLLDIALSMTLVGVQICLCVCVCHDMV